MSAPDQRPVNMVLSVMAGVGAGFVLAGCLGGGLGVVAYQKLARGAREGWNLVPVVVAAVDLEAGTTVTMEMISQRAIPEQFVTGSVVKPDSASYIVGQPVRAKLMAGDPLLWSQFETDQSACIVRAMQLADQAAARPSPAISQLLGALDARAKSGKRK